MQLTIHRGSHQIGGSCVELRADSGERILLDVGMPLAQPDGGDWPRGTMRRPGQELRAEGVLPDIDGLYAGSVPEFSALVLSHAHLDHHGLAHHVHPDVPVYGSRGTIEMLKVSHLFVPDAALPRNMRELPDEDAVAIGSFTICGIPVDHAAPDSRAILVKADGRRVLYSGDLRSHSRTGWRFEALVAEPPRDVDVLLLEGTTLGSSPRDCRSETDVEDGLVRLFSSHPDLIVTVCSAQNIDRLVSVYWAAKRCGRLLVIDLYTAFVLERARRRGIKRDEIKRGRSETVMIARSNGFAVKLLEMLGDESRVGIVWSLWPGYWDSDACLRPFCERHGTEPQFIHASGHAEPEDLRRLAAAVGAKRVIPIHTENPGALAEVADNVTVCADGELVVV